MTQSTGQRAASGAAYVGMAQVARIALSTLSTIIISRILTPGDYGVIAMAAPVMAFLLLFQDLGLSQATVQADRISPEQSSSLFWLNMAASLALTAALLAASPFVGSFYGDPRAGYVTAAFSLNILIAGSALQHSALLARDMRFGAIAAIETAGVAATFAASVAAAFVLRSYWALWLGTLCGAITTAALLWRGSGWRPAIRPAFAGAGSMARFGANITGFNLVNFLVRNLDNVLIARFSGAAQLGLYDRSYKLMMLPLQGINAPLARVMLPTLRRTRDDPAAYRRAFLTAVRAMMLATMPGVAVSVAMSDRLIEFLLGPEWSAAGPIFFWLSLTGLIQLLPNATGWLFVSSGRTREQLRWGLFSAVVTVVGFAIALPYGAEGIAASLFFTMLVRVPILYAYVARGNSVTALDLYRSMLEPLAAAAVTVAVVRLALPHLPTGVALIAGLLAAYSLAVAAFLLTPSGRDLLATLRRLATGALAGAAQRLSPRKPRAI